MSNNLKFCGCRSCRQGLHTPRGKRVVRKVIRQIRREAKVVLRKDPESEALTKKASVPYTD